MYGFPLHRQRCMSPKSTSITRASPQRHDFRCNQDTTVVRKFAHLVHSRCSRNRQPRASNAHPCTAMCTRRCRPTTQFESQTSVTLPLVLHQPMHTVRQQPARTEQQLATDVHTDAGGSVHNTPPRRSNDCRVHSSLKPNHCCAHSPRVSPHQLVQLARTVAQLPEIQNKTSAQHKQELRTMTAHNASQLRGASVATCPSFFAQSRQTSGGSRPLRYSSRGGCHVRRHRYGTK